MCNIFLSDKVIISWLYIHTCHLIRYIIWFVMGCVCVCITGCQLLGSMFVFWGVFTPLTSSMLLLNAVLIVYPRFFFNIYIYLFLCCLTIHVLMYYLEHVHFVLAATLMKKQLGRWWFPANSNHPSKMGALFFSADPMTSLLIPIVVS